MKAMPRKALWLAACSDGPAKGGKSIFGRPSASRAVRDCSRRWVFVVECSVCAKRLELPRKIQREQHIAPM